VTEVAKCWFWIEWYDPALLGNLFC